MFKTLWDFLVIVPGCLIGALMAFIFSAVAVKWFHKLLNRIARKRLSLPFFAFLCLVLTAATIIVSVFVLCAVV